MWTWEHPDGVHKAQINHILFRGKWRSSVRNCRAYSTVELGSDHRIVTAELKISQRVPRPDQKIVRRDMQALIDSTDLQERYRIEVSNRFTALSNNFNEKSSQAKHDEVANILDKANNFVLPKKVIKRDNWVSEHIETLVRNKVSLRNKYRNHRTQENYLSWRKAARLADESFENDQQRFLEYKCNQAEEVSHLNQSNKVYSITREISGKSATTTAKLVNKQNGQPPTDNEDLIKEWAAYFKKLLNIKNDVSSTEISPAANELDIRTDNFTLDELQKALYKMKSNR